MKYLFIILLISFCASCASFDVDLNAKEKNESGPSFPVAGKAKSKKNQDADPPPPPPEIIVVERPVFIPEKDAQRQAPPSGLNAAKDANAAGAAKPSDFSHAAVVYDYNTDWVYEAYAMPLRVCDIRLEPGERVLEAPFVSDSERWKIGAGVSVENGASVQHVYVKPDASGQEASLIINTDRRVYHIILRSYNSAYTPIVRWRYLPGLPQNFTSQPGGHEQAGNDGAFPGVDPRFISFNYRVTYSFFDKPSWLPELVFDDGSKTYIVFPEGVLKRELPSVFENRKDVVNYRVIGNLIVIDKLLENATVKIGKKEITVSKKRGLL
ncbi:hypothetical protein R84B8_01803 [Treponema sp. R8-4-B8]